MSEKNDKQNSRVKPASNAAPVPVETMPRRTMGKVIEMIDRNYFIFSVVEEALLRYSDYVEVTFKKEGKTLVLIGQVEFIVSKDVIVGQKQITGGGSILGISRNFVSRKDIKKNIVKATTRIIAFVDSNGKVHTHDPTIEYIGHFVKIASHRNLERIFSKIEDSNLEALNVGFLVGCREPVVIALNPSGLMRHTGVFGQSGSGKSFSFGVVLEELFLRTEARIFVIDPNADFIKFGQIMPRTEIVKRSTRNYSIDEHENTKTQFEELRDRIVVFSMSEGDNYLPLKIKFGELTELEQASILNIDPIEDREEYKVFREVRKSLSGKDYDIDLFTVELSSSPSVEKIRLLSRIENKNVKSMPIWGGASVFETLNAKDWKFVSFDISKLAPFERSITTVAVLRYLYESNFKNRKPTFVVIDEAHNFCPRVPWHEHQKKTRDILNEIAAEGRKYGVFLILLSQNPSKINEHTLSQCDNIFLMKMSSESEIQNLGSVLGKVGPILANSALAFSKGQALCVGGAVRTPSLMQFDLRKTLPGGEDLSKDWARKKM
jgi:DNA helicase HerA-like ATPase